MSSDRFGFLILAITSIAIGIENTAGKSVMWGDFPVPRAAGWIEIIFGIVLLVYILRSRPKHLDKNASFICPNCDTPYPPSEERQPRCPDCGVELEPLEGFYDRHPQKRKEKTPEPQNQTQDQPPST